MLTFAQGSAHAVAFDTLLILSLPSSIILRKSACYKSVRSNHFMWVFFRPSARGGVTCGSTGSWVPWWVLLLIPVVCNPAQLFTRAVQGGRCEGGFLSHGAQRQHLEVMHKTHLWWPGATHTSSLSLRI